MCLLACFLVSIRNFWTEQSSKSFSFFLFPVCVCWGFRFLEGSFRECYSYVCKTDWIAETKFGLGRSLKKGFHFYFPKTFIFQIQQLHLLNHLLFLKQTDRHFHFLYFHFSSFTGIFKHYIFYFHFKAGHCCTLLFCHSNDDIFKMWRQQQR